jgi:hypothetical protein
MNVSATITPTHGHDAPLDVGPDLVVGHLLSTQHICAKTARQARDIPLHEQLPVLDVLRTRFSVSPRVMLMAEGELLGTRVIDPALQPPIPRLCAVTVRRGR